MRVPRARQLAAVDQELFSSRVKKGEFVFDRVFQPATQADLFGAVAAPLVEAMLEGTNATIFAYGQTGTGKARC